MAGIYIHTPFCRSFCIYCDFFSVINQSKIEGYLSSLALEMERRGEFFKLEEVTPTTLYIGGGTPSILSLEQLGSIIEALKRNFNIDHLEEFTIEVNPNDITKEYAQGLYALGINRVSMGIQSFVDSHLKWMNRRHTAEEAEEAYYLLREAGFRNISLDLIFGFDGLTDDLWLDNLNKMVALKPEHISSYQLSIEPDSSLGKLYSEGRYRDVEEGVSARQYDMLQRVLREGGYEQYEISNFSLPGFRSKHNSSYWSGSTYLGLGPAAHSYQKGIRSWNISEIDSYILSNGATVSEEEREILTREDIFNEKIMLGLRTLDGVLLSELQSYNDLWSSIEPIVKSSIQENLLILDGDKLRIPPEKIFISDGIIRNLFII